MEKRICLSCGKTLVKIGTERENGKFGQADWTTRRYHKKCWKELGTKIYCQEILKNNI